MRIVSALVFILFSTAFTYGATPIPEKTDAQKTVEEFTFKRYLIILGAKTDYFESLKIAKAISKQSGHKYDRQGRIYDKKRGLILADDEPDEIYAGTYTQRRFGEDFISVEKSEGYSGLKPGLYIVLGGILDDASQAKKSLKVFKPYAPGAYIHKTKIYLGCMH